MHVIHANWSAHGEGSGVAVWAESTVVQAAVGNSSALVAGAVGSPSHPFAASAERVGELLATVAPQSAGWARRVVEVALPARAGRPVASPSLAHDLGDASEGIATLTTFRVPAIVVPPADVPDALEAIEGLPAVSDDPMRTGPHAVPVHIGASVEFFARAGRFVRWLLVQQRLVPTVVQDFSGGLRGLWQPWLADDFVAARVSSLLAGMPAAARAGVDSLGHEPWPIVEDFLVRVVDASVRAVMRSENMVETIEGRLDQPDPHVQWLAGLLRPETEVIAPPAQRPDVLKRVRNWIGALDARAPGSTWRLCLRLAEPVDLTGLAEFSVPGASVRWSLSLHLQSLDDLSLVIDAADIWTLPTDGATVGGRHVDKPAELLLGELGRAARLYKPLEEVLKESEPIEVVLSTAQAYTFLREVRPVLIEQGVGVLAPEWWDAPDTRLGVRLKLDSPEMLSEAISGVASAGGPRLGLNTLVKYAWQVTIGDATLSLAEFEKLAALRSPLVLIGGRWVEIRPEDVKAAVGFMRENPGGEMTVGRAMRLAYAADPRETGLPVFGMNATGWVGEIFGNAAADTTVPMLAPPDGFVGSLRPYQIKGLSWLAFLDRFGLGACLADDMGLGKTIQLLAMLLHERNAVAGQAAVKLNPTLLVVPTSVVGNWVRETARFAPALRVHVHHGVERPRGTALIEAASAADLVVTTYALVHRDLAELERVEWGRLALDEAQNIKNPGTKQSQAVRAINTPRRVALTGTPIENRLSELWSIVDFLNPGLLGTAGDFRTRFAVPIERYRDPHRAKQLRGVVQPFVLRRLKTDPNVISDLPEKVETKEFCYLTPEQAALYETAVKRMLSAAEDSDGIQRRGVILAGLVRLKQICNHPRQFLKDADPLLLAMGDADVDVNGSALEAPHDPHRSGKCARLIEMLDEVLSAGGQALVFTQFRQMGTILAKMLRHELDREVLFLHGGTAPKDRDAMVARFQKGDGSAPIFILSLKAGGVGLNLTGANHVFHFDRWWNPAVESQATDRAYRIGQTRTVQVHKFVVAGTLEERIDQMIEMKAALADNVIGSGEAWLTELTLSQLKDILALRPDAVEVDE
ncbi:MAG: DEAD/DEAH box helicase [Phycisphaerales bacterium]